MCVPDQKKINPLCHHEWYDWVLCAQHGTDDLGHHTPCPAAAAVCAPVAPVPVEDGTFCPVCFVASAPCGWICSICTVVNHCGPWLAVNCVWCGDVAHLGHVACQLCVRVSSETAETYHAGGGPGVVKPSTLPPHGGYDNAAAPDPAAAPAPAPADDDDDDLDFDVDMDEELEPISDIEEVYAEIIRDDGMIRVAGTSDLLDPAPRPVEEVEDEEGMDFAPGVFFGVHRDRNYDTMSDSE
ncbi:hypothetical protein V8F20_001888 [Naviculisporaceae sp. PSN 640]